VQYPSSQAKPPALLSTPFIARRDDFCSGKHGGLATVWGRLLTCGRLPTGLPAACAMPEYRLHRLWLAAMCHQYRLFVFRGGADGFVCLARLRAIFPTS